MNTGAPFQQARAIPCRTYAEMYAHQASLEDILGSIVRVAGPLMTNLLGSAQAGQSGQPAQSGTNGATSQANLLASLLNLLLGSMANTAPPALSQQHSLLTSSAQANRFLAGHNDEFAQPFFWQAILQAVAGPLVQALPQLMNAANQQRLQMKQTNNRLVTDLVSDVNRRMLLQQLLEAQRTAPPGSQPSADMTQLLQLLQQAADAPSPPAGNMPAAAPVASVPSAPTVPVAAPAAAADAPAVAHSLALGSGFVTSLSSKVILSFVTAGAVSWNGDQKVLFAKNRTLKFRLRLAVAEPAPKTPLRKAIVKVTFKDGSNQAICCEKSFKLKNLLPNSVIELDLTQDELSGVPTNKPIAVFAEMRWLAGQAQRERKALGSFELVLVNKFFIKERGAGVADEKELTDMSRFRPFWNKIWEAPLLDAAGDANRGGKKHVWELDVSTKYAVLLTASHAANGVMETKILRAQQDEDSVIERIVGRMKGGIELSIAEINKLLPLWDNSPALAPDYLEAFNTEAFAKNNAGEFVYRFKLKGRAGERGMIWAVPVFKLFAFTLHRIDKLDDTGQVVAVGEEQIRFPLPVSVRVLGLKSQR